MSDARPPLFTTRPERRQFGRVLAVLGTMALIIAGGAACMLGLEAAERAAPTYAQRGLAGDTEVSYRRDARSTRTTSSLSQPVFVDGGIVSLGERNETIVDRGIPVVLVRSAATGEVVQVRAPEHVVDTGMSGTGVAIAVAALGPGLVYLAFSRRIMPGMPWWVAPGLLVASGLVWEGIELGGPETTAGERGPVGMEGVNARVGTGAPERTGAAGVPITLRDVGSGGTVDSAVEVAVVGPPVPGAPPGADAALGDFDVVRIPVSTRLVADDGLRIYRPLTFAATSPRGVPVALDGSALESGLPCRGAPGAQGIELGPVGGPAVTADLCVAVPWGDRPEKLLIKYRGDEVLVELPR